MLCADPRRLVTLALLLALGGSPLATAQDCCPDDDFGFRLHHHHRQAEPTPPRGLDALATVQHVTALLLADPTTDWERVSIARLREHLVDLDRLTLEATVEESAVEGGLDVTVSGDERTLEAARRVLPEHAERMAGYRGWNVEVEELGSELVVRLRAQRDDQVAVLRAIGFFGFLSSGVYRPHQLLGIARGVDADVLRERTGGGSGGR